jgi:hypothetical protein
MDGKFPKVARKSHARNAIIYLAMRLRIFAADGLECPRCAHEILENDSLGRRIGIAGVNPVRWPQFRGFTFRESF